MLRTHTCGELTTGDVGKDITLAGWVHSVRIHGQLAFMDLRDRYGLTQCVSKDQNLKLKKESVVLVKGKVQPRQKGQENTELVTGGIEVAVSSIEILSEANPTPFKVEDDVIASEDLRLKYRYLDLRRQPMQRLLILRHKVASVIRGYMDSQGFLDIETPMIAKSTPEGARDYLVPSRIHKGLFYALPQSPQLYKQLLMISGFDRYYQVVRCFRDEDLRADRQPEFTQLDIEMSFAQEEDIYALIEGLMKRVWKDALGKELKTPFLRMEYNDAMNRFGSDKPDMRFQLELCDITENAKNCGFKILEDISKGGGCVKAVAAEIELTNNLSKKLEQTVKEAGGKGLVRLVFNGKGFEGDSAKFFSSASLEAIAKQLKLSAGNAVFIVADKDWKKACEALGAVRLQLGEILHPEKKGFEFLWVIRFPLMEFSEEEKRWVSCHHPFTSPFDEDLGLLEKDTGRVRSKSYDLVLNGTEAGGGSIRISKADIQERVFKVLGISEEDAKRKFGYFVEALKYGTPPHGGIALGLDRLIALIGGTPSIRDVIAFPKNKYAQSLLEDSPSEVSQAQLDELGLSIRK